MIIKSMSRKETSFTQLYDYITRDKDHDPNFSVTRNFIKNGREDILAEFERNAALLGKRKNGNYLYHEVISLTRSQSIPEVEQKRLLRHIAEEYARGRAQDCLVFGGLHDDKDHSLHFHLVISANRVNEKSRFRLDRKQFSDVKMGLERYVLEQFPELEQKQLITQDKTQKKGKTSNKEQEVKRRTKKPTQKEIVKGKLEHVFKTAKSRLDLQAELKNLKLEYYLRGKTPGVIDHATGRKHRLKTLGLEDQFQALMKEIDKEGKFSGFVDEFVRGDFSKRDQAANREKWKKQNQADRKVKDREDQTFTENFSETASEWVTGDYSAREARERNAKYEKKKKSWKDAESKRDKVKSRSEQTAKENAAETTKEWVFGDFSNRDARARQENFEKAKENRRKQDFENAQVKNKTDQSRAERIAETGKEWVAGDFSNRDKRQQKEESDKMKQGWQDAKAATQQPMDREHLSTGEKVEETLKEVVTGDFETRDARNLNAKKDENVHLMNEKLKAEKEAALKRLDENYKQPDGHDKEQDFDKDM